jgi:FkbM family methyltransferase
MKGGKMLAKQLVKTILCSKNINLIVRTLLKPISFCIPNDLLTNIPVVGKISVELLEGEQMILDGKIGDGIARLAFWSGFRGFEPETARIFYRLAKKSKVVFDIGANIGYYTLLAAISNKEAQVFAFEPVPRIYEYLNHNIELNRLSNVITSSMAVTNFDGNITLYIPAGDVPLSASTLKCFREAEEGLKVPAITLDTFVNENNISKVDLLKIDTEATEHLVLGGGRNTIIKDEPMIICEVLRGKTENLLQEFLSTLGYKYYWITDRGLIQKDTIEGDSTYTYLNYLFCKEEKFKGISKYLK